ncbi:tRNA/helicase-type nucleic acid binding protein [Mycobacteroides abscessus subsp. bolletii]|nr:tRNA/helicase-type nucleic acid binding protein [Mycobacteroides abscessus subsp. bolletii]
MAETGEDLDDTVDICAEEENTGRTSAVETDAGFGTRFSVIKTAPRVLYPDFSPLAPGMRVRLIWLGQRQVPGIVAGGYLRVSGMLSTRDEPVIYNPRYEIVPSLEG